jgi:hypothetical protein
MEEVGSPNVLGQLLCTTNGLLGQSVEVNLELLIEINK